MTITTEQLDALERGLKGVTPGPWATDASNGPANSVNQRAGVGVYSMTVAQPSYDEGEGIPDDAWVCGIWGEFASQYVQDTAHIARCDPDTIGELIRLARIGLEAEQGWQAQKDKMRKWRAEYEANLHAYQMAQSPTPPKTGGENG
jgi:hypothetical protein